jgi:membrane protein
MAVDKEKGKKLDIVKSYVAPKKEEIDMTTWKGFFQDLLLRIKSVDMGGMGAQLAYFFLLSFFPLIIFLVTLLPYLNLKRERIFEFLQNVIPEQVYSMVEDILTEVLNNQNGGLLSIGILATVWSASRGVDALMKGLNKAYDVEGRAGFINRLWSLLFTVSLVIVILLALIFPIFGQQISNLIFGQLGVESTMEKLFTYVRWITPPLLIFLLLWVMYWIVPNTSPRLKILNVLPGAIFATLGWLVLTYGFSFYISNFGNFSATYGSIGGVIILMLWLYFTGMILIFGGLLNATVAKRNLAIGQRKTAKSTS